jgi:glutaredoxin-related protein
VEASILRSFTSPQGKPYFNDLDYDTTDDDVIAQLAVLKQFLRLRRQPPREDEPRPTTPPAGPASNA